MTESIKLLDACRKGDILEVKRFLPQVSNLRDVRDNWKGKTLLHYSCHRGWLDVTRRLVEQYHCDPESRDGRGGDSPLLEACFKGHVNIVKYLVEEQGCSTACQNLKGDTPLHVACRKGHLSIAEVLLTGRNCSVACLSKNYSHKTVLHYSCRHSWLNVTRRLVEEYHCDPEGRDDGGDTPLHVACRQGHVDIVSYLAGEQRFSTGIQNKKGDTPLHVACRKGHVDIVRYLVSEQGYGTACQNKDGNTPLHVACRTGHLALTEILLTGKKCSAACISKNSSGTTILHYSCSHGWLDMTRRLVEQYNCDSESRDDDGDTPLHVACRVGHVNIVRYLVSEQGCSTACQNKGGYTPLHVACREGHVDIVRFLVSKQRCSTDCQSITGDTPLHVVCGKGHVDIVKYLVGELRCSKICQNKNGDTPLHVACRAGHLAVAEILLTGQDCSATCISKNMHGKTVLHYSCYHGWLGVTRRLVEQYHCDPKSRDNDDDTPLHVACHKGLVDIARYFVSEHGCSTACQNKDNDTLVHEACMKGNLAMVKALTSGQDCKAACNCQNNDGDTPLHVACHKGHVDIVKYLVNEQGCSTTCRNKDGYTPLHVACCKGHVDIVRYLVSEQGYNTAYQDKNGNTPLQVAFREGHLATAEFLTEENCSVAYTSKNNSGITILHYSCSHGWLDMTRRLVELYNCDPESRDDDGDTPFHLACRVGHVDVVGYLVSEQGCSVACQNKNGDTLLHEACRAGHLATAEILLIGKNCSAACVSRNRYGKTVLHYSCHHGWLDMTRRLVEQYHCDPEGRDSDGDTQLHVVCRDGHVDIVMYLVSKQRCSTACQNKVGNTPLHVACREGHVDIVRYLVEQGCSAVCQNKDGDTPLHIACRWDFAYAVQFLLSTGRVDPWCKNTSNHTPVQLTDNYTILKSFAGLTKAILVTGVMVFVFGNPAAGKSTLVKVIENKVTSRFGAIAGQFRKVSGVELKTAGINTVTIQNNILGTVTIYDLAGQFEYYSSHDALLGNLISSSAAIFITVVKLSDSEAEVIRTLRYWISFIENCCSRVGTTAHLMVVGSWADKVKEAVDQRWTTIKKACIFSSSPLHFVGFTALDCRKLASSGLDKICGMIGSSCAALREAAVQKEIIYPHMLHAFISTKLSSKVACSIGELCTLIRTEDDALLPTEPNLLSPLLSSLNNGGHLLYLPNKEDFEAGWVVINKQAVLSEINGTVFAPEHFKLHHDIATSTGVVPKSKIAGVFAEKYNIDMILSVLTAFEFCQKIKDSFTLSLIASSDPSRDGAAALTTSDVSSETYYFFPALVQVEHPTDVWQNSGPGQYQFGWCLQCSKDLQYLTPRFLHVLLLRLAFSFALAPDSSQQDEASPVLRRRCAIWKNGIQWLDQDGVETIVEVSEQNKLVLLLMLSPEGEEMACVQLRSSLISKILEAKEELCPGISTTELLIDPSNLFSYPLPSSSELTLYTMADQVVKAVREHKQFAVDRTGRRKMKLVDGLHFEPYLGMHKRQIDQLFDKRLANQEAGDDFLHDLAANIYSKLMQQLPIEMVLRMFNVSDDSLFYSYFEQFPNEKDNPIMRCFRLLLTWKNCDTGGSTYQSLRTTLDKYSIFCGRNPVSNQLK